MKRGPTDQNHEQTEAQKAQPGEDLPRHESAASLTTTRRKFLRGLGLLSSAPLALGVLGGPRWKYTNVEAPAREVRSPGPARRRSQAFEIRVDAARRERAIPLPIHLTNGDEEQYPNRIGSYSKGLPHDELGIVDPNAYNAFLAALK